MKSSNLKPAKRSKNCFRSICANCAQWGRRWLELWASAAGKESGLYMRWPGERPPPPPGSGPHRDARREDWQLAA